MTDHALAPNKGHGSAVQIGWGLVQIPVRMHIVVDDGRTIPSRSMFVEVDGQNHPVGQRPYDKVTDLDITDKSAIVKKVNVGEDKWVELTDDEVAQHSTLTPGRADIVAFVPVDDVREHYVIEKPGVWVAEQMKVGKTKVADPNATKAVSLLRHAMAERNVAALVMVPTRGGGQFVALFADGTLGWLVYAENVRNVPLPEAVPLADAEKDIAVQLIDGIGVSTPVLHDEAGTLIRQYLAAKASGEPTATIAAPKQPEVIDLMAALTASVAAAKPAKKTRAKKARAKKAS